MQYPALIPAGPRIRKSRGCTCGWSWLLPGSKPGSCLSWRPADSVPGEGKERGAEVRGKEPNLISFSRSESPGRKQNF